MPPGYRNEKRCGKSEPLSQGAQDLVVFGKAALARLREDEIAIEADLEDASGTRNELDRVDTVGVLGEDSVRQTDGFRCVVSTGAELDPYAHGAAS